MITLTMIMPKKKIFEPFPFSNAKTKILNKILAYLLQYDKYKSNMFILAIVGNILH